MKKRLIGMLLCGVLAFAMTGCEIGKGNSAQGSNQTVGENASNISVKSIMDKMLEAGFVRMPAQVDDVMAKDMYHINLDDVKEYAIAETQISPGPGLIVLVEAKDGKLDVVKESVDKILADKVANAFYPDEREITEKAQVVVKGNVVSLMILHEDFENDAKELLDNSI